MTFKTTAELEERMEKERAKAPTIESNIKLIIQEELKWFVGDGEKSYVTQPKVEQAQRAGTGEKPSSSPPSAFDSLPWKKNAYGDWVFANIPEAKPLRDKIGGAKKYLDAGYEYSVSGDGKFLNRKRAK